MTFNVEVVLRGRDQATTVDATVDASMPAAWTDADVRAVLVEMLRAIERVHTPATPRDRAVQLRGFSWIVEPSSEREGVVIAIEIPMGAAVAGPFAVPQEQLDAAIARVLRDEVIPVRHETVH